MVRRTIVCTVILGFALVGCAPATRLELTGNPKGNAGYLFKQMSYRDLPGGSIEMIGYGLIPFRNDRLDRDYNPRWPESGFATFWLHGARESDGRYGITMLGPAKLLGPGDDEVLRASIDNVIVESSGTARVINLKDLPTKSRNHPDMNLRLSGHLIARPVDPGEFDRQVKQYNYELDSRKIP